MLKQWLKRRPYSDQVTKCKLPENQSSRVFAARYHLRKYTKHSLFTLAHFSVYMFICQPWKETILGSGGVCSLWIGRLGFEEAESISGSPLPQIGRRPTTNDPCCGLLGTPMTLPTVNLRPEPPSCRPWWCGSRCFLGYIGDIFHLMFHGIFNVYIPYIWVNYHISLTWIVGPFGDDFPY